MIFSCFFFSSFRDNFSRESIAHDLILRGVSRHACTFSFQDLENGWVSSDGLIDFNCNSDLPLSDCAINAWVRRIRGGQDLLVL